MRRLQHLTPAQGASREISRRGRGHGSGKGGTSGRGHKGQHARGTTHPWFEGGQTPIQRRMSHSGFSNARFKKVFQVVNVGSLMRFPAETVITPEVLKQAGLISSRFRPVKILGDGELGKALTVCAHAFTRKAVESISAAGGTVEELG
jgi:large subunit ribosomal protein L15